MGTWPTSAGESITDYIEDAAIRITRDGFEQSLRGYLGVAAREQLTSRRIEVLFRITARYLRTLEGVRRWGQEKVEKDWTERRKVIATTRQCVRQLSELEGYLGQVAAEKARPRTALLASSLHLQVHELNLLVKRTISSELQQVLRHEDLSQSIRKKLKKKHLEMEYVSELAEFVSEALPGLDQQYRDGLILGTMVAAGLFQKADVEDAGQKLLDRIPMKRSRAKKFLASEYAGVEHVKSWKKEDLS